MPKFGTLFSAIVAAALALLSPVHAEEKSAQTPYVHAVIFYLQKDAPPSAADEIIKDCKELLAKIPTVRLLRTGKAVEGAPAPAKGDFGVGLVILFDDVEGVKTYIDHPLHKKFVEKNLKYFDTTKLSVYDFDQNKK